jgi:hypothetical protein
VCCWLTSMSDILENIIRFYGRDVGDVAIGKVRNYLALLASTGMSDEQLFTLGRAYLDEVLDPDPRYSGC